MTPFAIGIAGTAKNTGKTTVLTAVLREWAAAGGETLALTGIGYDGENLDNVTGLPKPRIDVYEGMLVAVSERCLRFSRAKLDVLCRTDIMTALGRLVIGRVVKPGKLVLAGPGKRSELHQTLEMLSSFGASRILVDGALNRIAPFSETDGVILATGAARHTQIERLAEETGRLLTLTGLAQFAPEGRTQNVASILTDAGYERLTGAIERSDTVIVDGVCAGTLLKRLAGAEGLAGKLLLFPDPFRLLLSGEIPEVYDATERLRVRGVRVGVLRASRVLAVTVNPYYPKYRVTSKDYEPAYVDRDALYAAICACTSLPCYDVVRQGAAGLCDKLVP